MELNKIYNIDCLDGMKQLDDNSIDAVVTDPPYGIAFMNKKWDSFKGQGMRDFFTPIWTEAVRVLKPGSFVAVMSSPKSNILAQQIVSMIDAGFVMEFSPIYWAHSSGFPKAMNISRTLNNKNIKIEKSNELNGSFAGFQPKPAVEVILIGMKPLSEKSYVEQAIKNGKGITWLEDCRIPFMDETDKESRKRGFVNQQAPCTIFSGFGGIDTDLYLSDNGRFPANLLVSDNILDNGTIELFSRHFDLDRWFYENIKEMPKDIENVYPFLPVSRASKNERNKGIYNAPNTINDGREKSIDNPFQRGKTLRKNIHPTVKPIKLMAYLITMLTRANDVVMDPFLGSGTTAMAARMIGRQYIGFEKNNEYHSVAEQRIAATPIQKTLDGIA
jgi:DNA modification methylase